MKLCSNSYDTTCPSEIPRLPAWLRSSCYIHDNTEGQTYFGSHDQASDRAYFLTCLNYSADFIALAYTISTMPQKSWIALTYVLLLLLYLSLIQQ